MATGPIIVIDVGKTLSKVTLWSRQGELLDRQVRPNEASTVDGIRRLDAAGIGDWLIEAMRKYASSGADTIVPVGHGAGVVALKDGALATPPFDYEQPIPPDVRASYDRLRDEFKITGSPALPAGLNMGCQLFWLDQLYPEEMRDAVLMPWAQYWAWFLTGRAVSEVTSLGCHTDLWAPDLGRYSPLAERMGWSQRFAPIVRAGSIVDGLRPEIAAATGMSELVWVRAGLHDSNAALLAARGFSELTAKEATVLSTGTWFVAMRSPDGVFFTSDLSAGRDCLINIDPFGWRIPSARFMGGREIATIVELDSRRVDIKLDQPALLAAVPKVLSAGAMLLPTLTPEVGPFPTAKSRWLNRPSDWDEIRAAVCIYAAMVAETSLNLIGAKERLLVEGRFAEAEVFVRALATLRPDMAIYTANAHNDVSFGALRLIDPTLAPQGELTRVRPLDHDLVSYYAKWQAEVSVLA